VGLLSDLVAVAVAYRRLQNALVRTRVTCQVLSAAWQLSGFRWPAIYDGVTMLNTDMIQKILLVVLGAFLGATGGWFTAAFNFRRTQTARINEYLVQKKLELNAQPELLRVVAFLRREREARSKGLPAPAPGMSGPEMRELPAFLEEIGTMVEWNKERPRHAFDIFAEEVLLCHRSLALWEDEADQYSDAWWGSFKKFASDTERRVGV
jgi:hypothetical protein